MIEQRAGNERTPVSEAGSSWLAGVGAAYAAAFLALVLGAPLLDDVGLWVVGGPLAACAVVGLVLHLVPGWWRFGSGLLCTALLVLVVYWAFLTWTPAVS